MRVDEVTLREKAFSELLAKLSEAVLARCCVAGSTVVRQDAATTPEEFFERFYLAPQHRSVPVFTSLLSTPAMGLAAISVTPVSV